MERSRDACHNPGVLRLLGPAAFFGAVASHGGVVLASPTFPPAIAEHLGLACEPDCTTCHTRPSGGLGTARQPFGAAMQGAHLTAGQPQKIAAALDELAAERSDVDGDGVTDIDELRALTDPNAEGEPLKCLDGGSGDDGSCSVNHAPPQGGLGAILASIAVGLFFLGRRHIASRRG